MLSFKSKLNEAKLFVYLSLRTTNHIQQARLMTTSKRVQDRSSKKRVHDLELATEKWKTASKVMAVMEILKQEPEMILPVRNLDRFRSKLNLPKPHKVSDFLRKSPKIFELYKDHKGLLWLGMTREAEALLEEEERLIQDYSSKAAENVTRCLMMSVDKRLSLNKIAHFRRDFGLPFDFRSDWVRQYPELFKVVKSEDEDLCLELVSWNPSWAVTELEKKVLESSEARDDHVPGMLSLAFPLKFPSTYNKVHRYKAKIENFQKTSYLSPYASVVELSPGSLEFDKRALAVMHELLSFTIEKRLVTDHLTHFRREFVMPQKLMRLLLKHFGIFYVSERGKRFSVFLTGAYEGQELIEKCPLVLWKEKLLSLIDYRRKKKIEETLNDSLEMEVNYFSENDSEEECISLEFDNDESSLNGLDDLAANSDEMEI